ncbi:MAG: Uma2 family endonuclease [Gemmataceae bacterium]
MSAAINSQDLLPPCHPVQVGEPAWDIALLFPKQGQWSEEEYLALDARTGWMIELSEGCLQILPMPGLFHQRIVKFLFALLNSFVTDQGLGEVLFSPLPVRLWKGKFREADIMFFRKGRIKNSKQPPHGADLAIEVVSEGEKNRERDLVIKREEYAKAKIAEYWIVDPQERVITVLTLGGKQYEVHGRFDATSKATSILLPGFNVDVAAAFAAGEGHSPEARS